MEYTISMELKPQDILVCLKLCLLPEQPTYTRLATELGMEESAIYRAVQRAAQSRLLHFEKPQRYKVAIAALEEFLIHGVKYAFPAQYTGAITRGIPTAYAAPPLNSFIMADEEPVPVWSDAQGTVRGIAVTPLYKTVPYAARNDSRLYELLSLLDAIRLGRVRERELAKQQLALKLRAVSEAKV